MGKIGNSIYVSFLLTALVVGEFVVAFPRQTPRIRDAQQESKQNQVDIFKDEMPLFPWQSVGLAVMRKNKERTYVSGFFVKSDLFVVALDSQTSRSNQASQAKQNSKVSFDVCRDRVMILRGEYQYEPNYDFNNVSPSHRSVKCVYERPEYGFALLKVEPIGKKSAAVVPIKLLDFELSEDIRFDRASDPVRIVGYGFSQSGPTSLKVSDRCYNQTSEGDSPFTADDLTALPDYKATQYRWSSVQCAYQSGMRGAPILVRHRRNWYAMGVVSFEAVGNQNATGQNASSSTVLLTPSFPDISRLVKDKFFGGLL